MARKKYKTAQYTGTVEGALDGAKSDIEGLKDEMDEWKSNMESNSMEHMPKYDEVSECYDALEQVYDKLEEVDLGELPDGAGDRQITYTVMSPYGRKGEPRWMRLANAEAMISAAKDGLETVRDEASEKPECACSEDNADADGEYGDHHELDCPLYCEDGDEPDGADWDTPIDALEEATGECGNVNFPGMY